MTWQWDASTSPDVIAYIFTLALLRVTGTVTLCSLDWGCADFPTYALTERLDVAETPGLIIEDMIPNPPLGECYMASVETEDEAGNRSGA